MNYTTFDVPINYIIVTVTDSNRLNAVLYLISDCKLCYFRFTVVYVEI